MRISPVSVAGLVLLSLFGVGLYMALDDFEERGAVKDLGGAAGSVVQQSSLSDRYPGNVSAYVESLINDVKNARPNDAGIDGRIESVRNLNLAYFDSRSESLRKRISDALSDALLDETDQHLACAIALSHSRLPYDENTLPNLKYAYEKGFIYFDDYYGELAHLYDGAPVSVRGGVIKEISESQNRYAVDIISGGISVLERVELSKEEVADLHKFLVTNEPIFSGSPDEFGFFEAILYSNWLVASSRLKKELTGVGFEKNIGYKLLDPETDPRAAVAFLVTGFARGMNDSQKSDIQWGAVHARAQELMRKYPDSAGLQQIGKDMVQ